MAGYRGLIQDLHQAWRVVQKLAFPKNVVKKRNKGLSQEMSNNKPCRELYISLTQAVSKENMPKLWVKLSACVA